jgi:hypothetical membrane protein
MEQRIHLANLKNDWGIRFLTFAQYALSFAGTNGTSSLIGTTGIIIPALSLTLSLVIGAVQPDYNPIKQTISQLVLYPYGWLQSTDFVVLGIWLILLAVKFYSGFSRKISTKIGALTLILFGIGFFLITIFPTNFPGNEMTLKAMIHEKTAQSICALFPISCALMIPEFKANRYWKKLTNYTLVTALIGLALVILGAVVTLRDAPLLGIIERLIFSNAVIWLVVIGVYMILQQPVRSFNSQKEARVQN